MSENTVHNNNEASGSPSPDDITLQSSPEVQHLNSALASIFSEIANRSFRHASDANLATRIRAYDNNQRLTFGRAQSSLMRCGQIRASIGVTDLYPIEFDSPDKSYFPTDLSESLYAPFTDVLGLSARTILQTDAYDDDTAMITLFCHRVLIRPQERYGGFFHRDLAPHGGRVGTIIWYPNIRDHLVDGLQFIAYRADEYEDLQALRTRAPDMSAHPSQYGNNAVALAYPYNYPHGVLPGQNQMPSTGSREKSLADFVFPAPDCFVKDLVIVTVSELSPVEQ